jgi:hypothetical protein
MLPGGVAGIVAGFGIGMACGDTRATRETRLAFGGVAAILSIAIFAGSCLLPMYLFGVPSSQRAPHPNAPPVEVREDARATGERSALQESVEALSTSLERNKQTAPLDRARDYARSEYENNKKIMSEDAARKQYDKDLANIAQEERDKGVNR